MTARKTVTFSKNASNLFFHILTKCNLRCRHCYINPEQQGKENLPLATIKAWLDQFASISAATNVIFLGGEPSLHPDLAGAVKYAKDRGFVSITVDTDGYLFHDILSRVSCREVDFFSFSLDGATRETNDRIRGEGSYDICLEGIQKAVDKGFGASLVSQNYFIFPNGRVYRCPLCEDHPLHSLEFKDNMLGEVECLNESDLFKLNIAEGCVMNKLIQPQNLSYTADGVPEYKIACCLLKEEVSGNR